MSKTIDERVVSMQFDNRNFETNAKTTMSTLEKLKEKLNLSGASKGLEEINSAVSKCDMSPLGNAVEDVKLKFSALDVIAVTALTNITNKAVDAGTQLVKSLSLDQVTAGFEKYEQKTANVQTLMNATGKSIDEINEYLNKLMWFSDETSYGFTDMTGALATMVSSGGDIEKLIPLITGVANATAFAGKGAAEFSRVMQYGINQAYSLGYMQVQDWKTIEGATVNSKQLMQALIDSAVELGKIGEGEITTATFRSTLADKWLDTEVMEAGFAKFSEFSEAVSKLVNGDISEFSEEIQELYNAGEIETAADAIAVLEDHYDELGVKAFKSAQEAKSFTEAIEATKDAVSSGWLRTFEIIFGDYEKAKGLWTDLANWLWDLFAAGAEIRNAILESALGRSWTHLTDVISNVAGAVETVTGALLDYDELVNQIIRGEWGNAPTRWEDLTAAGYDWAYAQNLVNERLGDSTRHATDYTGATTEATAATVEWTEATIDNIEALIAMSDEELRALGYTEEQIAAFRELEAVAKKLGIPLREFLENINEIDGRWILIESFKNFGRTFMTVLNSIKSAWNEIFYGDADEETRIEILADKLFDIIAAMHKVSRKIRDYFEENADEIKRTFKGLFAIINIFTTIAGGAFSIAFRILSTVLGAFNLDILDVAAAIGDAIVAFRDWLFENNFIIKSLEKLAEGIAYVVGWIRNWIDEFKQLEFVQEFWNLFTSAIDKSLGRLKTWFSGFGSIFSKFVDSIASLEHISIEGIFSAIGELGRDLIKHFGNLGNVFLGLLDPVRKFSKALLEHFGIYDEFLVITGWIEDLASVFKNWFKGLKEAEDPIQYIIDSIKNGFKKAISSIVEYIRTLGTRIWSALTGTSKDMNSAGKEVGDNVVSGFVAGIWNGIKSIAKTIWSFCQTIIDIVCSALGIHSPSIVFMTIGAMCIAGLIAGITQNASAIWKAITGLFSKMVEAVRKSKAVEATKTAFGTIAEFLGEVYAKIKTAFGDIVGFLGNVVKWIGSHFDSLAAIFGGIAIVIAVNKLAGVFETFANVVSIIPNAIKSLFDSVGQAVTLISKGVFIVSFALAIFLLSKAFATFADLSWPQIGKGAAVLAGLVIILGAVAVVFSKLAKNMGLFDVQNMIGLAAVMLGMAAAIAVLAYAFKILDGAGGENWLRNVGIIAILAVTLAGISILMSRLAPTMSKGSLAILGIAVAVLLLVGVLTKLNALTIDDPGKLISSMLALVAGLALISLASKGISVGAGIGMIAMALALRVFIGLFKDVGSSGIQRSMGVIIEIMLLFVALMAATRLAGDNAAKAGKAMMYVGIAVVMIAFAMRLLSNMDDGSLDRAFSAISKIMLIFGVLIAVSKFAGKDAAKAGVMLIAAAAAILILVGAMALIGLIPEDNLDRALKTVVALLSMFALIIGVSYFAKDAKSSLIAIAITIGILVAAIGILSILAKDDPKALLASLASLVLIMGSLALVIYSMKFISNEKGALLKTIGTMLVLSVIIILLGICLKQLATLEPQRVLAAAGALSAVMVALAAACLILSHSKDIYKKSWATLAFMFLALAGIGAILFGLQKLEPTKTLAIAGALSALLLSLSAACLILSYSKGIDKKAWITAAVMTGILAAIAGILALCQLMNVNASLNNVLALSTLINALAAACLILSYSKGIDKKAWITAAVMTGVLTLLVPILAWAQMLKLDASFGNVMALSVLLNALALACAILSQSRRVDWSAWVTAAVMLAVVAILVPILKWMQVLEVNASLNNVLALSILVNALAMACVILSGAGKIGPSALVAMGVLTVILLGLGFVLSKILEWNIGPCIGVVLSLSVLLIAMSIVTVILSKVGAGAGTAISGAVGLMGVILVIGAVALLIGAVMSLIPASLIEQWKTGFESFMDFIVILARGIGEAVGALIGGAMGELGTGLSTFMTNLQGFIEGAKNVDLSVAEAMKALGVAILAITAGSILNGLASLLGLGSMDSLGTSLSSFGASMILFAASISSLTEEDIARIKMAADAGTAMADMESSIPRQGGWWQKIAGEQDMADFGLRLAAFGACLVAFSMSISMLSDADIARIHTAADAGTAMAAMESSIPRQGGWWQQIAGEQDMADFGLRLAAFGACLVAFAQSVSVLTEEDTARIYSAADAGTAMAAMESSIPRSDGWWQDVIGEKDAETFGSRMASFGESLVKFTKSIASLPDDAATTITNSKSAVEALIGVYEVLPKDDGWWGNIGGERDAGAFGDGMYSLAIGLKKYSDVAANLGDDAKTNIENSKPAVKALKEVADLVPREGGWGDAIAGTKDAVSFGTNMEALANSLMSYADTVSEITEDDITAITNSQTAIESMASAAKALPNTGGLSALLAGDNDDIPTFGANMEAFAISLMSYADTVSEITEDDVTAIEYSTTAMESMASAAGKIPNSGGVAGWLFGDNDDIPTFGANMEAFAISLMAYADTVSGITEEDVTAIDYSATAMESMASAAGKIPNSGGVAGWLFGDNDDIASFGTNMEAFAISLMAYADTVSEITEEDVTAIEYSATAIAAMAAAAEKISNSGGVVGWLFGDNGDIASFGTNMEAFGDGIVAFANKVSGISDTTLASIESVGQMFNDLANVCVDQFMTTIDESFGEIETKGSELINSLAAGIDACKDNPVNAIGAILSAAVETVRDQYVNFRNAGKYLTLGVASGIRDSYARSSVISAAVNVARAANQAARDELGINSPAIAGIEIGEYYDAGIVVGLENGEGDILNSLNGLTTDMTDTTTSGLSSITNSVGDVFSNISGMAKDGASGLVDTVKSVFSNTDDIGIDSVLSYGSTGDNVKEMQRMLKSLGYDLGQFGENLDGIDGSFGPMTEAALKSFQQLKGLKVDGVLGAETLNALQEAADVFNESINTEPVITPVVDMSEWQKANADALREFRSTQYETNASIPMGYTSIPNVSSMTSMLTFDKDALADISSISNSMNTLQNGASNDDLLDELKGVNTNLKNFSGDTYTINGVTYDDGSATAAAVEQIAKEALLARRR